MGRPGQDVPDADLTTYAGRCAPTGSGRRRLDGFDASITIPYRFNNLGSHGAIAEAVQQDVSSVLGLNMTMDSTEWQVYTSTLSTDRGWDVARLGWQADYLDASTFIDLFTTSSAYNYSRWSNADCDALCASYKTMAGGTERVRPCTTPKRCCSPRAASCSPIYYYTNMYCLSQKVNNACAITLP